MTSQNAEDRGRVLAALRSVALEVSPYVSAVAAFIAGVLLLVSGATPAITDRVTQPVFLLELSHFADSVIGVLLMLLATGLWRRRIGAYWLAIALLIAGALFSLAKGLEYGTAAILAGLALYMLPWRPAFDRPSRLFSSRPNGVWMAATVAAVLSAGALGFFTYREVAYTDELLWTFVRGGDASRFLRAGVAVALLTLIAALITLFTAPSAWSGSPPRADLIRARMILDHAERGAADAALALVGDKDLLFSDTRQSFIAFRQRGGRWIALGGPVGLTAEVRPLMWRFAELADQAGATPVFYRVSEELLPTLASMGFVIREVGECAIVRLADFSLRGKARQDLRTARNRAAAEGCRFEVLPPGSALGMARELEEVSDAWLARQAGTEKGFSMGRFDPLYLDQTPLAIVHRQGRCVAFANVLTLGQRAAVDIMRYGPHAPPGIMDYLLVELIEWAKAHDFAEFSLGMAPLSGLENRRLAPLFNRLGALAFEIGGPLYSFEGLRAYKAKFATEWRPMFMAGKPGALMPLALLDVALLTSGGWRGLLTKG